MEKKAKKQKAKKTPLKSNSQDQKANPKKEESPKPKKAKSNKEEKVEEPVELNLTRQSKLVPQEIIETTTFKVFGVGSVGSKVVKLLAKTGAKLIEVYDLDTVEEENIAAQEFDFRHIGMNKVDAMKAIVLESTGVEIITHHGRIDEKTEITPEPNTIYMCFFDSIEARKILFNKLKDYPVVFVDGRIGLYFMRHYLVDLNDPVQKQLYADTLEVKATTDLVCGEKSSAPINSIIAGKIVMNAINFISDKTYEKVFIGSAEMPKTDIIVVEERKKPEVKDEELTDENPDSVEIENPFEEDEEGEENEQETIPEDRDVEVREPSTERASQETTETVQDIG